MFEAVHVHNLSDQSLDAWATETIPPGASTPCPQFPWSWDLPTLFLRGIGDLKVVTERHKKGLSVRKGYSS